MNHLPMMARFNAWANERLYARDREMPADSRDSRS